MKRIFSIFKSRRNVEDSPISRGTVIDEDVKELDYDQTLVLARQVMTLARRRRCAVNHLGENNPFAFSFHDYQIYQWYLDHGCAQENIYHTITSDLQAIAENPKQVSQVLQDRIILTDYFSRTRELEDCYDYGDINPFIFESDNNILSLKDTFSDQLDFPTRVATIISFDPEIRGHRHQIRYFRALLVSYSLARLLSRKTEDPAINLLLEDEQRLAIGWLTTSEHLNQLSIMASELPPDENLLYNQEKVHESYVLFKEYANLSEKVIGLK